MITKAILPLLTLLLISGCTSSSQYHAYSFKTDTGYVSYKKDSDHYAILCMGYQHVSAIQTRDFALLRSAEVTKESGASFFRIVEESDTSGNREKPVPTTTSENAYLKQIPGPLPTVPFPDAQRYKKVGESNSFNPNNHLATSAAASAPGEHGPRRYDQTNKTYTYDQTSYRMEYQFLIQTFLVRPSFDNQVYTADTVISELRAKYRLKDST